ncbi:Aldehyde/histidinol dehydrogenase [Dactylonectria macrodidyma]|uniref:aldehyde dehydrogenase (NAD(+)) n=1 Tax=Dactylonectria macrodidyma TaxID=307937 RepID=A0A9P9IH68_9HYPO|nr:Aldehyde/histidinol dehydrogenase [Dactylonectria macrodidyma]
MAAFIKHPETGAQDANVPEATKDDVNQAVAAAQRAFPEWSASDLTKGGSYIKKLAALIKEHNDELSLLEAESMGRLLPEFFEASPHLQASITMPKPGHLIQGQAILNTPGYVTMTLCQPFRVVAAIIPWNASLLFFASNQVKPKKPLGATKFAELIDKAGFPPGVYNVISSHGNPAGATLAWNSNLKKVILEFGSKSPVIVFNNADLDHTVKDTMYSIQWNCGQVCMANFRVYIKDIISQKFIEACKKAIAAAKANDLTHKGYETVLSCIDEGKRPGTLTLGGKRSFESIGGFFIEPTIFIIKTEEEAIPVYTKNIDRFMRVAEELNSGYLGITCTSPSTARDLLFGGYKSSGQGRAGYLHSIDNSLEVKSVITKVEGAVPDYKIHNSPREE